MALSRVAVLALCLAMALPAFAAADGEVQGPCAAPCSARTSNLGPSRSMPSHALSLTSPACSPAAAGRELLQTCTKKQVGETCGTSKNVGAPCTRLGPSPSSPSCTTSTWRPVR